MVNNHWKVYIDTHDLRGVVDRQYCGGTVGVVAAWQRDGAATLGPVECDLSFVDGIGAAEPGDRVANEGEDISLLACLGKAEMKTPAPWGMAARWVGEDVCFEDDVVRHFL